MKNLYKNESGFMGAEITLVLSLIFVAVTFWISMPIQEELTNRLIALGGNAPISIYLFYLSCMRWGFTIFALAAITVYVIRIWKRETTAIPQY